MASYYNEIDPFAAAWLRELIKAGHIADGVVDERSIVDVRPDDLRGFTQCHFFAGIGGWSYALRLAGWPDDQPVWTGSCPCQPHSSAARGRHVVTDVWPPFFRLIQASRPGVVFGEQVDEARAWLDGVCADLEAVDYTVWADVLPAYGAGFDHARERIYFAGDTYRHGQSSGSVYAEMALLPWRGRQSGAVGRSHGVSSRMARVRAFGNAIVPQVAAAFIQSYRHTREQFT